MATRTLRAYAQAAVGERDAVPGLIVCVQTFGSVAHRHPHPHVLKRDGACRRDGTFVPLPEPEPGVLEESWRGSVPAEFVRRGGLEADAAAGAGPGWLAHAATPRVGGNPLWRAPRARVVSAARRRFPGPAPRHVTLDRVRRTVQPAAFDTRRPTMGGFLEGFMRQAMGGGGGGGLGEIMALASKHPQVLQALAGLLSTRDASVGGSGGLAGLVGMFQQKGMGDLVSGWIAKGPNPAVSPQQLTDVLGADTMGQFAAKAGMPVGDAGSLLARLLPTAIDQLTPDGTLPATDQVENTLSSLRSLLGR